MWNRLKEPTLAQVFVAGCVLLFIARHATGQLLPPAQQETASAAGGPPPSSVGIFPLGQVHRGLKGKAWTVFEGTTPEPMDLEILGVLRGARGPGRDLILARLLGARPEFTGVVAGMSGSPVYVDGKLVGALSYRIGQFTKEPIGGITPIEQMLEVRDLPQSSAVLTAQKQSSDASTITAMETPLLMSGFQPEAIQLWKDRFAGTGLEAVSAGGGIGASSGLGRAGSEPGDAASGNEPILPGSAVSLQLVRGDLEIAATCTVTYVDPTQLLACGHPIMQAGMVSFPMTSAEVIATVASPLNAFKIINTGRTIGAFTEDRDAAIRGEFGAKAEMIPVSVTVSSAGRGAGAGKTVEHKLEVVNLPSLTPTALLVSIYQTLLQTNQSSATMSYRVTGDITVKGMAPVPVDVWSTPGEQMPAQLAAALGVGEDFARLYANATRLEPIESVRLHIDAIPHDLRAELESVRLISSSIVHAGDTVTIEATLRPWEKPARNLRIPFVVPSNLQPGTLRILVSGAGSLDRTLDAARPAHPVSIAAVSERMRAVHAADRLYVSLLLPESQASIEGHTLAGLPLSMANSLDAQGSGIEASLNGESIVETAEAAADGVVTGQQLLTLRIESGGGPIAQAN